MVYLLEAVFDLAGEWIIGNYLKLMTAIIPIPKLKKLLYALLGIIFIAFIFGVICLFSEDRLLKTIGVYAVAISSGVVLINIIIGLVLKKVNKSKNK